MITILLFLAIIYLIYKYSTSTFDRWKYCGVPYDQPLPLFGNLFPVMLQKKTYSSVIDGLYHKYKGYRFCGAFNMKMPTLILRDLDLINSLFISDFSKAPGRGMFIDAERDPLSLNLFFMEGQLWKTSREKLRPGFKSSRLRCLIDNFDKIAVLFMNKIKESGGRSLSTKEETNWYSATAIAGPVLGLDVASVNVDDLVYHSNQVFSLKNGNALPVFLRMFQPKIATKLGIKLTPRDTVEAFKKIVNRAVSESKDGHFADTIFHLQEHFANQQQSQGFLDALVYGQFFLFILAGYETTSTTLSFAIYLLSKHKTIYQQLRQEIQSVLSNHNGQRSYEALKEMVLLENIIKETLRLHPPVSGMLRVLTSTYEVPNSQVTLQPGDTVCACISGVHRDPQYYEEPDKFNPHRFNDPIPDGAFIPFGLGPRICIGKDLAMLELKTVLSHLVMNFELELDLDKTSEPLEFDPSTLFTQVKHGIWVKFKPNN